MSLLPRVTFDRSAMFHAGLPTAICLFASAAAAESLHLPGLSPDAPATQELCENIPNSQENCVRVLACVGDAGVYFDGQARGWDEGPVLGRLSTGETCEGGWRSDGPGGTGLSSLSCSDATKVDVVYYSQDSETGTVIGRGLDSQGRHIRVWSGENVLTYLTDDGETALPCAQGAIPIS